MKSYVYSAHQDSVLRKYYPISPTQSTPKLNVTHTRIKVDLKGLRANQTIFFFAAMPSLYVVEREAAYGHLRNAGVVRVSSNGNCTVSLYCPGVYINPENNTTYSRHFHFVYWDSRLGTWETKLYTHQVKCPVTSSHMRAAVNHRNIIIVDALSSEYYITKHIKNAINIPHNGSMSTVNIHNKHTPVFVYCWDATCNAGEHLMSKLAKKGYHNVWHYPGGIQGWRGAVEHGI